MATFVATQLASEALERARLLAARRQDRRSAVLLVTALTLLALAVNGYHPYAEDGGLYMAGVKRLLDPALYPHATGFVLEPMRFSLFAPAVAEVVRLSRLGLPAVLLGMHLASVWVTLFAAWMLAVRCWAGREAQTGAIVLLACWLGLPVAGTALLLMDPYLTARSLSTPCMVLALVGALDMTARDATDAEGTRRRGWGLWLVSILLAAAMHPLMAAYALGASLMLICVRAARPGVRWGGTLGLAAAALGLAALLQAIAAPESAAYVRVALTRSYWFVAQWRWYEVVGLAAPLAILGVFARNTVANSFIGGSRGLQTPDADSFIGGSRGLHAPDADSFNGGSRGLQAPEKRRNNRAFRPGAGLVAARALAGMALAAGATAAIAALRFARAGAPTHLVARMQPLRVFHIVYLAMVLVLGATLGERVLGRVRWRWGVALAVLGGTMLAAARAAYPDSRHLELPWTTTLNAERNPWVQAFLWVRANTPKDALFALDADYINARNINAGNQGINARNQAGQSEDAQCFRAIAERSALADYSKDGGEASIAPELTGEWVAGQRAQATLSAETDAERVRALGPLGVSWVVLQADAATGFDCPYRNPAVQVCRLR